MNNDIAITSISSVDQNVKLRSGPVYLIEFDNSETFIATKLDEFTNYVKAVGFFYSKNKKIIDKNYQEIIKNTNPEEFVEIMLPWKGICSIKNLIYKYRAK